MEVESDNNIVERSDTGILICVDAPAREEQCHFSTCSRYLLRHLLTGQFLPRENDLCARYNVSRTVIREALKVLESKGLVRGRSRVGTVVCEHDEWNILDPQVIEWLGDRVVEFNLLDCVLEARRSIEPAAVVLAARKATTQEIADIEKAWQMMRDAENDIVSFTEADVLFTPVCSRPATTRFSVSSPTRSVQLSNIHCKHPMKLQIHEMMP